MFTVAHQTLLLLSMITPYIHRYLSPNLVISGRVLDGLEDMMKKHNNWKQEKEWRIVRKSDEDYLSFDDDLVGIVFGCKINKEVKQCIIEHSTGLKLLRVHPGLDTMQIKLLDNDIVYDWSGGQTPFIGNTAQLEKFLLTNEVTK